LEVQGTPGLSDALAGAEPTTRSMADLGIDGLHVLVAGTVPPNPAELLASPAMRSILDDLTARSDLVVLDSSALLGLADSLELVRLSDLTLLVTRTQVSRKRTVQAALERIQQVGGKVSGAVLNDVGGSRHTDAYTFSAGSPPPKDIVNGQGATPRAESAKHSAR
jgi:Mrp family chromosome partitioning ATPase